MKKLKMRNEEITQLLDADMVSFPKYATQLIIWQIRMLREHGRKLSVR
jgi:hypothetical protein